MSKVETALDAMGKDARDAFLAHLVGGTPVPYLADWAARAGHPIGKTSLKDFRKKVRHGSQ